MKIVHLSQTDAGAGAGRAAYRIHRSLRDLGVDSTMLVGKKRSSDSTVESVISGRTRQLVANLKEFLEVKRAQSQRRSADLFLSPAKFGYFNPSVNKNVTSADIVCLYWINGGFILPESLSGIKQPIVWRLSDVWPFTGGCHYPGICERYTQSCGNCPQLRDGQQPDPSHQLFERKRKAWKNISITVTAPSHWIADLARKSALFHDRRIEVIPTGVDTNIFTPQGKMESRARLGIPQNKKILLFGAMDMHDKRKGFSYLQEALHYLARSHMAPDLFAVTFGKNQEQSALPVPSMNFGHIEEDSKLALLYSAADVVVVPSLEDNLPNIALEAIACGTPVAGFDSCGMRDIVKPGLNGALATVIDAQYLAKAIEEVVTGADASAKTRQYALENFSSTAQAAAYLRLFGELGSHAL